MENGIVARQNTSTISSAADMYRRSPAIWATCPLGWIKKYYPEGHVRWDARRMSLAGTQTTQIAGPIEGTKVYNTGALVVDSVSNPNSTERWGAVMRFGGDTDNDSASLAQAYPTFRMSGVTSTSNRLWFEVCLASTTLLVDTQGWMVGLAETELWTLAAGVPFNGGDAITNSASFIGFRKGEDALGVVDTVTSDRATSFTNVSGGTTVGGTTDGSALSAANTFAKFGFTYDTGPGNDVNSDRCVRFFQDNVELASAISKSTLLATTNLKANALGPIIAIITDSSGTAALTYVKWLEVAQLPPLINP